MLRYSIPILMVCWHPAIAADLSQQQATGSAGQKAAPGKVDAKKGNPCTPLGEDAPFVESMAGNDRVYGSATSYRISGGDGRDLIIGSANGDINGGNDADTLVGGGESDRFVYDSHGASIPDRKGRWSPKKGDTIVDFRIKDKDRIDLAGLQMKGLLAPSAYQWGGSHPGPYSVWVQPRAGDTIVLVDADGDALGDVAIRLLGDIRLSPAEFCGVEALEF